MLPRITVRSEIRFDLASFSMLRSDFCSFCMICKSANRFAYSNTVIWLHMPPGKPSTYEAAMLKCEAPCKREISNMDSSLVML